MEFTFNFRVENETSSKRTMQGKVNENMVKSSHFVLG